MFPKKKGDNFETSPTSESCNKRNISLEDYIDAFSILTIGILGKGEAKNWHPLWSSFMRERERERERKEKRNELVDGPVGLRFELGYLPSSCSYQFMYTTIKSFPLFLSRDIRTIIYNSVSLSRNSFMFYAEFKIPQRNTIIQNRDNFMNCNRIFSWNQAIYKLLTIFLTFAWK